MPDEARLIADHDPAGAVSVSAVVVTFRRQDLLPDCLRSLRRAFATLPEVTEIVVVDNGSPENVASDRVRDWCPEARVVTLPDNRGYAGGITAGLSIVRGEWVFTVGDDATVDEDAIGLMLAAGRSAPDVGSVAAKMLFADESDGAVINSAGIEIDRLGVATDRLLGQPAAASEHDVTEVFGASGGAALYRTAMLADVGAFDASFVLYLEDADLAWRARRHGWRCLYVPAAVVHHHHSATTQHRSESKYFYVGRNRIRMLAKNASAAQLRRYGALMVLYDACYVAYALAADRTLAPARGRISGLRRWRSDRRSLGATAPVTLAPPRGLVAALRRNRAWASGSGRS